MLSEKDAQQLADIEHELVASDPQFVTRMRSRKHISIPAVALAAVWVATLIVTALCGWIAVVVMVGSLVMLEVTRRLSWRFAKPH
ncbi:MAG: DUF3040 domain-containing protein [Hamadaea sp.]|uniref:DUF3040 domain-containing protein n=1 Tax=Hamadaea sp. TaxID=2024425 RepID=UPI0017BDA097|nr:DUF3040 domain-containing protein [Hamadaea sp.]NUT24092.1 DUF3040 domain-containing protein [Hamadaea sp.]